MEANSAAGNFMACIVLEQGSTDPYLMLRAGDGGLPFQLWDTEGPQYRKAESI